MSPSTRHLLAPAAAAAAIAMGVGAAPALASVPSNGAATARTPLVAAITAQTPKIHLGYVLQNSGITGRFLLPNLSTSSHAVHVVDGVPADAAQHEVKLEWILGANMQGSADTTGFAWVSRSGDHFPAVRSEAIAEFRLSNFYVGQADSQLRVAHPARTAYPFDPDRKGYTPPGPGTVRAPVGLVATLAMAAPVLQEQFPDDVVLESPGVRSFVSTNLAAARYYALIVSRLRVDAAQRQAQREWVTGAQTQVRGDELYADAKNGHVSSATIRRGLKAAFAHLRTAHAEMAHADARLGVHPDAPSLTLPAPLPN